jgi:hypothetical protein
LVLDHTNSVYPSCDQKVKLCTTSRVTMKTNRHEEVGAERGEGNRGLSPSHDPRRRSIFASYPRNGDWTHGLYTTGCRLCVSWCTLWTTASCISQRSDVRVSAHIHDTYVYQLICGPEGWYDQTLAPLALRRSVTSPSSFLTRSEMSLLRVHVQHYGYRRIGPWHGVEYEILQRDHQTRA